MNIKQQIQLIKIWIVILFFISIMIFWNISILTGELAFLPYLLYVVVSAAIVSIVGFKEIAQLKRRQKIEEFLNVEWQLY